MAQFFLNTPDRILGNDLAYWISPFFTKSFNNVNYNINDQVTDIRCLTDNSQQVLTTNYHWLESYDSHSKCFRIGDPTDINNMAMLSDNVTQAVRLGGSNIFTISFIFLPTIPYYQQYFFDFLGTRKPFLFQQGYNNGNFNTIRMYAYGTITSIQIGAYDDFSKSKLIVTGEFDFVNQKYKFYINQKLIAQNNTNLGNPLDINLWPFRYTSLALWASATPVNIGDTIIYKGTNNNKRQKVINYLNSVYKVF